MHGLRSRSLFNIYLRSANFTTCSILRVRNRNNQCHRQLPLNVIKKRREALALLSLEHADDLNGPDPTRFCQDKDVKTSAHLLDVWVDRLNLEKHEPRLYDVRNLASLVPHNQCLQQLVQLGVNLSKLEQIPGVANMLVKADFEKDIAPKLWFLADLGFEMTQITHILTVFPKLIKLSEEEIGSRIVYFTDRGFRLPEVFVVIVSQPAILSLPSVEVDKTLGEIMETFKFTADEIRIIVTKAAGCILQSTLLIKDVFVVITKMMGFSMQTTREMILAHPNLILASRRILAENFIHLHNRLGLTMDTIAQSPKAICSPPQMLAQRTNFMVQCKLLQPNGSKPLFTPLDRIVEGTDEIFCHHFLEGNVELYNDYLKTI